MTTLEILVKQRGALKRKLTCIETYINLRASLEQSIEIIKKKEEELDKILEDFEKVQVQIENFITEENEANILFKAKELEEQYWKVKNSILNSQEQIERESESNENESVRSGQSSSSQKSKSSTKSRNSNKSVTANTYNINEEATKSSNTENSKKDNKGQDVVGALMEAIKGLQLNQYRVGVKVPELTLPKFNGNIEEWTTFYETFESIIHNEPKYSKIDKYHYLSSCLSPELKHDLLARFKLSNDGYELALEYLKNRYSNQRTIINKHFSELFVIKTIDRENPKQLRDLLDCYCANIDQVKRANPKADLFDLIIVFMMSTRLDDSTKKAWELHIKEDNSPTWSKMRLFLEERVSILERMNYDKVYTYESKIKSNNVQKQKSNTLSSSKPTTVMTNRIVKNNCGVCKEDHKTHQCPQLLKLDVSNRFQKIKELKLCYNCLKAHNRAECNNKFTCRECCRMGKPNEKHHTILHFNKASIKPNNQGASNENQVNKSQEVPLAPNDPESSPKVVQSHHSKVLSDQRHIFLLTAIVYIERADGEFTTCRALLDSGSESCFITESLVQNLGLRKTKVSVLINGLNDNPVEVKHEVTTVIKSRAKDYSQCMDFLVVPRISNKIPREEIHIEDVRCFNKIFLADPGFQSPSCIDILIGGEFFLDLIEEGKVTIDEKGLFLKSSVFGWLVAGKTDQQKSIQSCYTIQKIPNVAEDLNLMIKRFWELEEVDSKLSYTNEEEYCEDLFQKTTQHNEEGRFVVMLPTRSNFNQLKNNKPIALKCLEYLEKRLAKDPGLHDMYCEFMAEYRKLNHMCEVEKEAVNSSEICFYLPHHPVLKPSSTTTKLRVVFNASSKSCNNLSLNDTLCVGPVVQNDLFNTWVLFRTYRYAMVADAKMMYRQILVHPSQNKLQRIFWRENPSQQLKCFSLLTLTYGTSPASCLATRCLKQLAIENQKEFPEASKTIENNMYMDDLLAGASTIKEAIQLRNNITQILMKAKFQLRKWISNNPEILHGVPTEDLEKIDDTNESIKALGLNWKPKKDTLTLNIKTYDYQEASTKRTVLSDIAGFFDPLGIEGPVIVIAKIFIQELWQMGLEWDDELPNELHLQWQQYRSELHKLKHIEIDRFIAIDGFIELQVHGFCDASQKAYGACVYILSRDVDNQFKSKLLCAKSKVAPINKRTLPELELCGAELLSKLIVKVKNAIGVSINKYVLWSDSSIVLAWLKCVPNKLKVFVANRVSAIQRRTDYCKWRHVRTDQNPADFLYRGLMPNQLIENHLWWCGPQFLVEPEDQCLNLLQHVEDSFLSKSNNTSEMTCVHSDEMSAYNLIKKFSSIKKMSRVLAYVYRFISFLKIKDKRMKVIEPLTTKELNFALSQIIKAVQNQKFKIEMSTIKKSNEEIKKIESKREEVLVKSSIQALNPFCDELGLLRVGGRICKSSIKYDQKHPIILPSDHIFTEQLIREVHQENLHPGQRAMLSFIRQKYWPLRAKVLIKRVISKCVRCTKSKPIPIRQYMRDLPARRVQLQFPFFNTGVDYCGPFHVKSGMVRSKTVIKTYVAVFVCLATKAIHLELVSDMTSSAFLAALDRFYSDHGVSAHMYSDNGKNFIGAANEINKFQRHFRSSNVLEFSTANSNMTEVFDLINSKEFQQSVTDRDSSNNIQWHFIPPHAPEFGGLWETAVKSVKYHIVRVLGNALLTFEEFYTILKKIAAVLNSRPLVAESDDVNDYGSLTPAHFLIGRPMNSRPEEDVIDISTNRLDRWRRVQNLIQQFHKAWHKDYLHLLQQRSTRYKKKYNIQIGDLVLMVDDNLKPMKWPTARVIEVHPGDDQLVRVATVRNQVGTFKRPVAKLCWLPIESPAFQGPEHV